MVMIIMVLRACKKNAKLSNPAPMFCKIQRPGLMPAAFFLCIIVYRNLRDTYVWGKAAKEHIWSTHQYEVSGWEDSCKNSPKHKTLIILQKFDEGPWPHHINCIHIFNRLACWVRHQHIASVFVSNGIHYDNWVYYNTGINLITGCNPLNRIRYTPIKIITVHLYGYWIALS